MSQTAEVLALVKRLREEGHGLVIISNNLADVFEVADRITVLRLGRWVGTFEASKVGRERLVGLMTGAVEDAGVPEDAPARETEMPAPAASEEGLHD